MVLCIKNIADYIADVFATQRNFLWHLAEEGVSLSVPHRHCDPFFTLVIASPFPLLIASPFPLVIASPFSLVIASPQGVAIH